MTTSPARATAETQQQPTWFPGKVVRFVTVVIAFLVIISGYGGNFNPERFWYIAFTSLGFPILFMLNLVMLIIWVIRARPFLLIPLLTLGITSFKVPAMIQWNPFRTKPDFVAGQFPEIKLMSYNVRLFDLYNWSHNEETKAKIFNLFEQDQPAILCIQEFYSSERKNQNNVKSIMQRLNFKYKHVEYPINLHGTDHYGMATFSRFPIVDKGVIYFDKKTSNICIFTDLKIDTDTIRVYNCHLQSVRFGDKDYKFIESITNNEEDTTSGDEAALRTKNILKRLKKAFVKRAGQTDLIAKHVKTSPYPVIICGDLNDTPTSYTYNTLSDGLTDTFRESGNGLGTTYAGPIPGLRIDYIFHSTSINSYEFRAGKQKLSDHYPIMATLIVKK